LCINHSHVHALNTKVPRPSFFKLHIRQHKLNVERKERGARHNKGHHEDNTTHKTRQKDDKEDDSIMTVT